MTYPNHHLNTTTINSIREDSPARNRYNDSNEDIFENHSAYKKTQYTQSSLSPMQTQNNSFHGYGNSSSTHNLNLGLIRPRQPLIISPVSTAERPNYCRPLSPLPPYTSHPPSFQSEEQYLYMQRVRLDNTREAVRAAKKQLAEIEHETLMKDEEYYLLTKVQKNPTKNDITVLESEICEINRSIQRLYHDMDNVEATTASKGAQSSIDGSKTANNSNASYKEYYNKKPSLMSPLESPTTKLLRNPIDNSLVFSQYDS